MKTLFLNKPRRRARVNRNKDIADMLPLKKEKKKRVSRVEKMLEGLLAKK